MFVAVTGVRIRFAASQQRVGFVFGKPDGLLRAVLYARKTELAVALHLYALRTQFIITSRADGNADTATDASISHGEILLALHQKTYFGVQPCICHKAPVHFAFFLCHRFVPTLLGGKVCDYSL